MTRVFMSGCGAIVVAASCGPEAPPEQSGGSGSQGEEVSGPGPTTGATGSPTSTGGDEAGGSSGTGDSEPPPPALPQACTLVRVEGDARVPIDADSLLALRMSIVDPGAPQTPPRVMTVQYDIFGESHSNYRARSFVLESWPAGVVESEASLPLTRAGHSISRLAPLATPGEFAYVWTGDPRGDNSYDTFFSVLDVDAWSVGGEVLLASNTNPDFVDLLATPSLGRFVSTYITDSYGLTPKGESSGASLGILDIDGSPLVAATPLTLGALAPGGNVRSFWAGESVAVAIGHNACAVGDPLCSPHAVMLARPGAPDRHGAAADGFTSTQVIEGLASTQYVSRPAITREAGFSWMIWFEGQTEDYADEHRSLRGVVLTDDANMIPWPPDDPAPGPIEFLADTDMESWPSVLVSQWGITAVYRTHASTFEVHHHDFAFKPLGAPIVLELDSSMAQFPAMGMLAHPHALLLAWGEQVDEDVSIRMVQLECGEN